LIKDQKLAVILIGHPGLFTDFGIWLARSKLLRMAGGVAYG